MPSLPTMRLRGAVADLRDADDLAQVAVDKAEAKAAAAASVASPRPQKARPSRQADRDGGHHLGGRTAVPASPVKPISSPVARISRANIPKPCTPSAHARRAIVQQDGPFVGSRGVKIFLKKLVYQSGRPDLNRRPLDPQSRSGRRWASLSGHLTRLDSRLTGCRLMSACVGSWFGSFAGRPADRTAERL